MTLIVRYTTLLMLSGLIAGCASTGSRTDQETLLGAREQKSILAKARPLQEYGFTPSFPFGNNLLYFGATLLQPNQTASRTFEEAGIPVIELCGDSPRKRIRALLDPASNASWMQYSCAAKNDVTFLTMNGQVIPYLGTESREGANTFAGVVPLLQIGQLSLNNTPFYVRMAKGTMAPVVYSRSAPHVDAVLGYDNLRQFQYIQFNLEKDTVRLATSSPYTPDKERLIGSAGISSICRDRLAVSGSIFGQPVPIVLDFAGDFSFARGDIRDPKTKQVELGEVVFLNVPTEVLTVQDIFPRAGRRMLKKYIVTVCPRDGVVYFERP